MKTMSPDNDPLFCHSTLVCKHNSKPFEYNSSTFDTAEMEVIIKDNQNRALCDLNKCEKDAAPLEPGTNLISAFRKTQETGSNMGVKDSANKNEKEVRGLVIQCAMPAGQKELFEGDNNSYAGNSCRGNETRNGNRFKDSVDTCTIPSSKTELLEEEKDLYTDNNAMECELPELVVHYKDDLCHVVKDICIDDGVPLKDKILTENGKDKDICTLFSPCNNKTDDMTGNEFELSSSNGSKTSSEKKYQNMDAHDCATKGNGEIQHSSGALRSADDDFDDNIHDAGGCLALGESWEGNCKLTDQILVEKFGADSLPSSQKFSEQRSLISLFECHDSDGNEIQQQSAQIQCSPVTSERPAVSAPEESNSNNVVSLSYNSKVEIATITFDFKSSKTAAGETEQSSDGVDPEHPLKIESEPRHEFGLSDRMEVASEVQHGQGESSFSVTSSVSGLITYSGPITHSGSISLRSDSSTTSTRSFAFPVLQSEWNSSPVRMAKPDRRRHRRHRGWRHGLLCCRF